MQGEVVKQLFFCWIMEANEEFFRQNLDDNRLCRLLIKTHNLQKNILFYYFILLNQTKY